MRLGAMAQAGAMVDLKNQALPRALSDVVADLADLFEKELRLAKAELSEKLSIKAWAGVWMAAAAFFALLAVILGRAGRSLCSRHLRVCDALGMSDRGGRPRRGRSSGICKGSCRCRRRSHAEPHYSSSQTRYRDSQGATFMSRQSTTGSDWLLGAVKQNPEGLLLLAAGACLLLRKTGGKALFAGQSSSSRSDSSDSGAHSSGSQRSGQSGRSGFSQALSEAQDYASDIADRTMDTVGSVASTASDYASKASRAVGEQSSRVAQQAQSTFEGHR